MILIGQRNKEVLPWYATAKKMGVVNRPPVAVDDVALATVDTPTTINVLVNDADPDGPPITVISATAGSGTVTIVSDQELYYTPQTGFTGVDTINYTIADGDGLTDSAVVTVTINPASVALALTTETDNTLQLTANPAPAVIEVQSPSNFAGTYAVDLAGLTILPINLVPPKIPATAILGATLQSEPGLWIFDATQAEPTTSYKWLRDGVAIPGGTLPNYTVVAADQGSILRVCELQTTINGLIISDSAEVTVPMASTGTSGFDSFTGPNNSLLTEHISESGDTWVNVGDASDTIPLIVANQLEIRENFGGVVQMQGIMLTDVEVAADVSFGIGAGAVGIVARTTGSSETSDLLGYYARYNWNQSRVQLFAYNGAGGSNELVNVSIARPSLGTYTQIKLRCQGTTIQVDWDGTQVLSISDASVAGPGSIGIGHYDDDGHIDNFTFQEITT